MLVYWDPQGYPPRLRNPEVMATEAELNPLEACLIQPACGSGKSVSSCGIRFLGNDGVDLCRGTESPSSIPIFPTNHRQLKGQEVLWLTVSGHMVTVGSASRV